MKDGIFSRLKKRFNRGRLKKGKHPVDLDEFSSAELSSGELCSTEEVGPGMQQWFSTPGHIVSELIAYDIEQDEEIFPEKLNKLSLHTSSSSDDGATIVHTNYNSHQDLPKGSAEKNRKKPKSTIIPKLKL